MVPADSLFVAFGEVADLYVTGHSANAEQVTDESTVLLKPVPEGALLATVARMLGTLC
jgi:hypothetical protein